MIESLRFHFITLTTEESNAFFIPSIHTGYSNVCYEVNNTGSYRSRMQVAHFQLPFSQKEVTVVAHCAPATRCTCFKMTVWTNGILNILDVCACILLYTRHEPAKCERQMFLANVLERRDLLLHDDTIQFQASEDHKIRHYSLYSN